MKYLYIIVLLLSTQIVSAQFNITLSKHRNDFKSWNDSFYNIDNSFGRVQKYKHSLGLETGYLFRMKQQRIDITPSIGYFIANQNEYEFLYFPDKLASSTFRLHHANFNIQVKSYPFDFNGLNQPTIIKHDKNVTKESLYVSYHQHSLYIVQVIKLTSLSISRPLIRGLQSLHSAMEVVLDLILASLKNSPVRHSLLIIERLNFQISSCLCTN